MSGRAPPGRQPLPSVLAEVMHFLGEVEVVFGLWAVVLAIVLTAEQELVHGVALSERHGQLHRAAVRGGDHGARLDAADRRLRGSGPARASARLGGATPAAWWVAILTIGPLLGSFVTEPAAMTICALLLARQFFDCRPSARLKYATLGSAVRERVNRRHAHALRGAARPDGRASLGMGHGLHAQPLRLALDARHRRVDARSTSRSSAASCARWRRAYRRSTSSSPRRTRSRRPRPRANPARTNYFRCRRGSPSRTCCSWPGPSSTRTTPRCSSAASCSSWDSRGRPRRISRRSS